jgi:TRAP-type C4-dicarboxylate transport system permease small subunit
MCTDHVPHSVGINKRWHISKCLPTRVTGVQAAPPRCLPSRIIGIAVSGAMANVTAMIIRVARLMDRCLRWASFAGVVLASGALIAVMVLIVISVVARNLFHVGLFDAIFPTKVGMVFVTFIAGAWCVRQGKHVAIDLAFEIVPPPWRYWMRAAGLTVGLGALLVATYNTLQFALAALRLNETIPGDIRWPAFPLQMLIPIGLSITSLEILRKLILDVELALTGRGHPETGIDAAIDAPKDPA